MNKTVYFAAAALIAMGMSGCAAASPTINQFAATGEEVVSSPTAEPTSEAEVVDYYEGVPTGAGEICDINSMYTADCESQFPEVGYLNGIHRATIGLSLVDAELLIVGEEACAQIASGVSPDAVDIPSIENAVADHPDGWNDSVIGHAASITLCL